MRKCWKRLAERADIAAYSPDEVIQYMEDALLKDLITEIPSNELQLISEAVDPRQGVLFSDAVQQLEAMKGKLSGNSLGDCLIECIVHQLECGNQGQGAVEGGLAIALEIWNGKHIRQVEEHYHRESNRARADNVRERLESAAGSCDYNVLATKAINDPANSNKSTVQRQSGLDDGVELWP